MRVLIAPDSFKGSMSSREAGERMAAGLRAALSSAEVEQVLLADGGEGNGGCPGPGLRREEGVSPG